MNAGGRFGLGLMIISLFIILFIIMLEITGQLDFEIAMPIFGLPALMLNIGFILFLVNPDLWKS